MEFRQALEILQLTDVPIDSKFEMAVKKKYRSLVLKYHTDIVGDKYADKIKDIISAHEVIKNFLKTENSIPTVKSEQVCIVIGLQDLINIHNGKELTCCSGIKINRKNIHNYVIMVECIANVECNNNRFEFHSFNRYDLQSIFEINCEVLVTDTSEVLGVKISCLGNSKELKISGHSIKYIMTLEYNTKIAIIIKKKLIQIE